MSKLVTVPRFMVELMLDLLWKLSNEIAFEDPAWDEVYEIKHDLTKRLCNTKGNLVEVVDCDTPELDRLSRTKGFNSFEHLMSEAGKTFARRIVNR